MRFIAFACALATTDALRVQHHADHQLQAGSEVDAEGWWDRWQQLKSFAQNTLGIDVNALRDQALGRVNERLDDFQESRLVETNANVEEEDGRELMIQLFDAVEDHLE